MFVDNVNFFPLIGSINGAKIAIFIEGGFKGPPYGRFNSRFYQEYILKEFNPICDGVEAESYWI